MNAHMAIHVSDKGEKVITQPRDIFGRFKRPVKSGQVPTRSYHVTFNGQPVRLKAVRKK